MSAVESTTASGVAPADTIDDSRSGAVAPRLFSGSMVALALLFLVNNYLTFWLDWPGVIGLYAHQGWFGVEPLTAPLAAGAVTRGWLQLLFYAGSLGAVAGYVLSTPGVTLQRDADRLSALAAYIVRGAFWGVLLVGLADMVLSFLRVEGMLDLLVSAELNEDLGKSRYRGAYVHYPLVGVAFVIALFTRSLGFIWLTLLVVLAEFQIVVSRFVFSYEQAFMGDLVRFWYAALFLFASAHALIDEGHVRVDVFYTHFSERRKALANLWGSLLLGLPLCWVILTQGMWTRGSSLNSPLLSYEISQSGFGMYVKYLMAGFLVVFALSMIVQFSSYIAASAAVLRGDPDARPVAAPPVH